MEKCQVRCRAHFCVFTCWKARPRSPCLTRLRISECEFASALKPTCRRRMAIIPTTSLAAVVGSVHPAIKIVGYRHYSDDGVAVIDHGINGTAQRRDALAVRRLCDHHVRQIINDEEKASGTGLKKAWTSDRLYHMARQSFKTSWVRLESGRLDLSGSAADLLPVPPAVKGDCCARQCQSRLRLAHLCLWKLDFVRLAETHEY